MKTKIIIKCGISFTILLMFNTCSSEKYIVENKYGIDQVNKKIISGQEFYTRSYNDLLSSADKLLNKKFNSVLDKKVESPSGMKTSVPRRKHSSVSRWIIRRARVGPVHSSTSRRVTTAWMNSSLRWLAIATS